MLSGAKHLDPAMTYVKARFFASLRMTQGNGFFASATEGTARGGTRALLGVYGVCGAGEAGASGRYIAVACTGMVRAYPKGKQAALA